METEHPGYNIKAMLKVLGELADMSEHATLTGAMGSGLARAVDRYNSVLRELAQQGAVPKDMFAPLPVDATFGDLAVDARLLRAYIKEGSENGCGGSGRFAPEKNLILRLAPFADSSDLRELVDSYLAKGSPVDAGLIESLAPFLDSEHLGVLIRKIAKQGHDVTVDVNVKAAPRAPVAPVAPNEPAAPASPAPIHRTVSIEQVEQEADERELDALVHHDVPIEDRMRALTDRMRDPATSPEEFEELSAEVLRLKRELRG